MGVLPRGWNASVQKYMKAGEGASIGVQGREWEGALMPQKSQSPGHQAGAFGSISNAVCEALTA